MIPKIIHLCWFSGDPFPVEIKVCLDSWKRLLPDYEIRLWDYAAAKALDIPFVNEALEQHKWAFAGDVVRFYAVWRDGGVYMDSDILLFRRFDELMEKKGFVTMGEKCNGDDMKWWGLQAAFFMGEKGNQFCKDMVDSYRGKHFVKEDGTFDQTVSPHLMVPIAEKYGWKMDDSYIQELNGLTVYPTEYLSPRKKWKRTDNAIGEHRIFRSWRKRGFGRQVDVWFHHVFHVIRYAILKR